MSLRNPPEMDVQTPTVQIIQGDALHALATIPDQTVHLTFTSPPYYNARDYAHYPDYETYLETIIAVVREIHRVTAEGRFFVINTSPIIVPRQHRHDQSRRYAIPYDLHPRICAVGFDFIDDILWVKPTPASKNRNAGFQQHRQPLTYKANPVAEYLMVYRKRTHRLIDWNLRQYPRECRDASRVQMTIERENVWYIPPAHDPVHPAVFPLELARRIVALYSFIGDTVLDPFAGTGTVGCAALELQRNAILIERDPNYCRRARERIAGVQFRTQ